ncbi:hypothetical protein NL676_002580 [Syzygium grande]|nr:hypothetical protein NL676_002580 [Syzygium grande]
MRLGARGGAWGGFLSGFSEGDESDGDVYTPKLPVEEPQTATEAANWRVKSERRDQCSWRRDDQEPFNAAGITNTRLRFVNEEKRNILFISK